jgi:hypothetical protein
MEPNLGEILVTSIINGVVNMFTSLGESIVARPDQWWPIIAVFGGLTLLSFLIPASRRTRRRRVR